jgi:hypothetical protein
MDEVLTEAPRRLYSADPGLHGVAVASWHDGRLESVLYVRPKPDRDRSSLEAAVETVRALTRAIDPPGGSVFAVELMQPDSRSGRAQTLAILGVSLVVGGASSVFPWQRVLGVRAGEWTKGIPKNARALRIWRRLHPEERDVLPPKLRARLPAADIGSGMTDHMADAIGIGLHTLGRLQGRPLE